MAGLFGDGLFGDGTFGGDAVVVIPEANISVRELPPLRLSHDIETPSGRRFRWADDEPRPENIPNGVRFSDTIPGGYEAGDATLPRKPGIGYSDLDRLSNWRVLGAGGRQVAWEGRLERAPRVSGDTMAVSPSAVGWQANLADDKSAKMIYVDRDLSRWQDIPLARRVALAAGGFGVGKMQAGVAEGGLVFTPPSESLATNEIVELHYDCGAGLTCAKFSYKGARTGAFTGFQTPSLLDGAGSSLGAQTLDDTVRTMTPSSLSQKLALFLLVTAGPVTPALGHLQRYSKIAVYGDHGLTTRAISGEPDGVYASDVVAHAVARWAPLLDLTVGETVLPSSFVIPHLTFPDATTAAEIIKQVTRYGLQDWAVWDDKTFYWHDRGALGRKWRARIGPAQLEETGPQVDRLWESIIVQYQDVDGSTRTTGPPGSGADTEDAVLHDDDPENPANQLGIIRRDLLVMGVGTAASATEVGRRFLEESKLLDSSGRAQLVGHVTDDRGVLHPYWKVRAGDTISFVDAADPSYRRIVRTSKDVAGRSCSVDLDAPPEGLAALLERLGVVLVPLGL